MPYILKWSISFFCYSITQTTHIYENEKAYAAPEIQSVHSFGWFSHTSPLFSTLAHTKR